MSSVGDSSPTVLPFLKENFKELFMEKMWAGVTAGAMHFDNKMLTLITFGIAGCIMITGYIFVSALCGAIVRDYTPEKDAGKLQGVRMIFSVLIPMLIGPMLGNAINKAMNIPLNSGNAADAMTTEFLPAPEIFLAGAICAVLMFALIPLLSKAAAKAKAEKTQIKEQDHVA